ncbi:MAG: hypothetical protein ACOZQL_22475 [Myxococcota bacterium]
MKRTLVLLLASLATACQPESATPAAYVGLRGLTLETPGTTFPTETSLQLRAWGHLTDGSKIDVTDQTEWTSSVPSIGTISASGIVHLGGVGASRFEGRYEGKVVSVTLFATAATLESLELSSSDSGALPRGDSRVFRAIAHYSDGTQLDVTDRATWTTDGSVLGVGEHGLVVGREQGEGVVQVRFFERQLSMRVEVTSPRFRYVSLQFPSTVIRPGDTHALRAVAAFSDGSEQDVTEAASWVSSDPSVFVFGDSAGRIVARDEGRARITATWNGSTASVQLDVFKRQLVSLSFERASVSLPQGLSERVGLWADFDDGSRVFVSDGATWSSSQKAVAEVSDELGSKGVVLATGLGTSTITATYGGRVATYQVNGLAPVLQRLSTTSPGGRLLVGQQLDFAVMGTWSDGQMINLSGEVTVAHGVGVVSNQLTDRISLSAVDFGPVLVACAWGGITQQTAFEVTNHSITQIEIRGLSKSSVTPGPVIGQQRFVATATYSDGLVADITEAAHWWLDDPTIATMNDEPGVRGTWGRGLGGTTAVRLVFAGQQATLVWDFPADI